MFTLIKKKSITSLHSLKCHVSGKMLFLLINQKNMFGVPRECCVMTLHVVWMREVHDVVECIKGRVSPRI